MSDMDGVGNCDSVFDFVSRSVTGTPPNLRSTMAPPESVFRRWYLPNCILGRVRVRDPCVLGFPGPTSVGVLTRRPLTSLVARVGCERFRAVDGK